MAEAKNKNYVQQRTAGEESANREIGRQPPPTHNQEFKHPPCAPTPENKTKQNTREIEENI